MVRVIEVSLFDESCRRVRKPRFRSAEKANVTSAVPANPPPGALAV
jgi:hypothetical protein